MAHYDLGLSLLHLGIFVFVQVGKLAVQFLRIASQQAVVGGIAYQRVFEAKQMRRTTAHGLDQTGVEQGADVIAKGIGRPTGKPGQDQQVKYAADDGRNLRDPFLIAQSIESAIECSH